MTNKLTSVANELLAIPTSLIISKCILILEKHSDFNYIVLQPNNYEYH